MATTNCEKLFAEFPAVSTEAWEAAIAVDLKGADYERKLVWRTTEGFNLRPYYRAENLEGLETLGTQAGEFPYLRGVSGDNSWLTHQTIAVKCPKAANEAALKMLNAGVDSLGFCFCNAEAEFTAEDLDTLLAGIVLPAVELTFCGKGVGKLVALVLAKAEKDGVAKEDLRVNFAIDPIVKHLSQKGDWCEECEGGKCIAKLADLVKATAEYKHVNVVNVSANVFSDSGSTIVEELGFGLSVAHEYKTKGLIDKIHMSTRPDYISQEIIDILKQYTITKVELGIQTMNDKVLSYLKRGHTVKDTINTASLLTQNGIEFVGQMMIGLPTSTIDDELYCAKQICLLGASAARIYPTLVFKNTELELLTKNNDYIPLTLDEAVERSAVVLKEFTSNNVDCIRIGLCDSENLHSDKTFVAGPNSPSMGEMVKSRMFLTLICDSLSNNKNDYTGKTLNIYCSIGCTSQIIGHKRKNIFAIKSIYGFKSIKVIESTDLKYIEFKLEIKEENSCV
jgi:hypothetical protein